MERPDKDIPSVRTSGRYTSLSDFISSFEGEVTDLLQKWSDYADELEGEKEDLQEQVNRLESRVSELEDNQ